MNQILSVEMSKNNSKGHRKNTSQKASIKSIIIFFSIVLIIFGIAMTSLGVYSKMNHNEKKATVPVIQETGKPRIDVTQNGLELDVEISAESEITKIEYWWNQGSIKEVEVSGGNTKSFTINVPAGSNDINIMVTDANGKNETFNNKYTGEEQANVNLEFNPDTNALRIKCQEEKTISKISYNYDDETIETKQINSTTAEVQIPIKQGEHNLTVKVDYEDGSTRSKTEKVYFPVVQRIQVPDDGSYALIKASDVRKITRVKMNLNGTDLPEETPNSETFEQTIESEEGENRLILTVYNSDGVSITTRTMWIKAN